MPLCVNGFPLQHNDKILKDLYAFNQKYQEIFEERSNWLKSEQKQQITRDMNCLYVNQREMAAASFHDHSITSLGSDMMTTCHIVVLRCKHSKATGVAHFDGSSTFDGVQQLVHSVCEISKETKDSGDGFILDLHVVGGFEDDRGLSIKLSLELLQSFSYENFPGSPFINLITFCTTFLNQRIIHKNNQNIKSPVIFGLVVMLADGEIHPCVFDDDAKGPMPALRNAKSLHGHSSMINIYRWKDEEVVIDPFTFIPFPNLDEWLEVPDFFLRKYMSTSPEVEPDNFEFNIRKALVFIRNNPDPLSSIFKENKSLRFQKDDQGWKQVEV